MVALPDGMDTLYVVSREEWRGWLVEKYGKSAEIWLIYPRKHSGQPRIPYNTAVEEALCFGWIDSITRTIDDDRYAQRFTPRRPRSTYSQTNIERLRKLIAQDKILPEIAELVADLLAKPFDFPADIVAALKANPLAWENFQKFSGSYQRIRVAYVETGRKRGAEFEKRLNNLVTKSAQNRQFGFGIEDYY